jgi:putative ABC transport system permease protein
MEMPLSAIGMQLCESERLSPAVFFTRRVLLANQPGTIFGILVVNMAVLDDLRYAFRALARGKMTSVVIVLSLALGTGANATLYSVMDALLFRPPAGVADARELARVFTSQYTGTSHGLTSYPDFISMQQTSGAFATLAAFDDSALESVRWGEAGQRLRVVSVSPEFFPVLDMRLQAGSIGGLLVSANASSSAASQPSAIISDALWTLMGRPGDVVGRELTIGETIHAIAGVAPAGFSGLQLGRASDVWIPLPPADHDAARGNRHLSVIGRLRDGRRLEDAERELAALGERLATLHPETNRGTRSNPDEPRRMSVAAYSRLDVSARSQILLISTVVMGSTGLLLLSACVNAGSLLLSRSAARRRELAVKLALGARRAVLVRQVVLESLAVSTGGAVLGLLFARWTAGLLPVLFAPDEAALLDTHLDATTVLVTVALSCLAGAVFALGPARHALAKVEVQVLRGDSGAIAERSGSAVRGAVVVFQVALSTVLLIASGLMVRALSVALEGDLGPGGRRVVIAFMRLPGVLEENVVRGIRFHVAAVEAARKLPDAEAAGWVFVLPVGRGTSQAFRLQARPDLLERLEVEINVASPGYFQATRIPLIEGRLFNAEDRALSKPVIVVNDMLARRYFGPDAVGHRLQDEEGIEYEIVGVVRSGKYRTLQEAPEPMVYFPLSQRYQGYLHLVVRTRDSGRAAAAALPGTLAGIDSGVGISRITTFDEHLAEALTLDRILTTVVAGCGLAALALAMIGVYGVVGDAVRRRTPEIGLRVALGAPSLRILQLVFSEGLPLSAAGSAAGVAAALLLSRILRTFVHDLPPVDLTSLAIVPIALLFVVVGAAALPVRRALRVSPTIALRAE